MAPPVAEDGEVTVKTKRPPDATTLTARRSQEQSSE